MKSSTLRNAFAITLSVLALPTAFAQSPLANLYVGVGAGTSRVGSISSQIADSFTAAGQAAAGTLSSVREDRSDTGYKIFLGYKFASALAVEASYADFGKFRATYSLNKVTPITQYASWSASALSIDAIATASLHPTFDVYLRGGVGLAKLRYSEFRPDADVGDREFTAPKSNQARPHLGLGVQWNANRNVGVRLEWERTFGLGRTFSFIGADPTRSNGKLDYDVLSLSALYKY